MVSVDPITSQQAVKTAIQQWGHLDGIILNAGVLDPTGTIESIPVEPSPGEGKLFSIEAMTISSSCSRHSVIVEGSL